MVKFKCSIIIKPAAFTPQGLLILVKPFLQLDLASQLSLTLALMALESPIDLLPDNTCDLEIPFWLCDLAVSANLHGSRSGRRDLNSRPHRPKRCALPTALRPAGTRKYIRISTIRQTNAPNPGNPGYLARPHSSGLTCSSPKRRE